MAWLTRRRGEESVRREEDNAAGSGRPAGPPKQKWLERIADTLDLPGDIVARLPRIEITGCRRLYIENHQGLMEYEDNLIQINGGAIIVTIRGDKLQLHAMNARELLIGGVITAVEFGF